MEFFTFTPGLWASGALIVAAIGVIAAVMGWGAVSKEKKNVEAAKQNLLSDYAWTKGFEVDEIQHSEWLRENGIQSDSIIGDYIRACWSAWLGNRSASLAELHSLVSRRERVRISARLSGSIAALLLIIGIVGTLLSVHPILKAFQFRVSSDGELQDTAESTALVNSLINDLGEAFLPSIAALIGTILVVIFRGAYFHALHGLTLELDRFAIGSLLPRYRPPSAAQEYRGVKEVLSDLATSIANREEGFEKVVNDLSTLVQGIGPAVTALEKTASTADAASERLSSRSKSIADGLSRNLGKNSPMYKAVSGFEGVFRRSEETMTSLKTLVDEIRQSSEESRSNVATALETIDSTVRGVREEHEADRENVAETVKDFRTMLTSLPGNILSLGDSAVQQGMAKLRSGLDLLRGEQMTAQKQSADQLTAQAQSMRQEVDQSTKQLPAMLDRIDTTLSKADEVERVAVAKIVEQGQLAADNLRTAADEVVQMEKAVGERLSNQTDRAASQLRAVAAETSVAATKQLEEPIRRLSNLIAEVDGRTMRPKKKRRWYWPFGKKN